MSNSKVPQEFLDNFERWCANEVAAGRFTELDVEELRGIVRQDLKPGPDLLRAGLWSETPERDERYRLWDEFFGFSPA